MFLGSLAGPSQLAVLARAGVVRATPALPSPDSTTRSGCPSYIKLLRLAEGPVAHPNQQLSRGNSACAGADFGRR